ncbi:MAG: phospho-sugar mutase [Candidatus Sumerlaeaceae bacterium]|jgi:phosphoglucomutase
MLDKEISVKVREFVKGADAETVRETVELLLDALEKGDVTAVADAFYQELDFGTGGLRGIMGAGTNRMNRVIVARATQGLVNYILKQCGLPAGVCIAYDSRHRSAEFAREAARVIAGNGLKAYLFEDVRPTPELSFAVRHFKAKAGIVITASHNPKEYNGYKVYWSDGAQVVPPHDRAIIEEVRNVTSMTQVKLADYEKAVQKDEIHIIGGTVDRLYLEALEAVRLRKELTFERGGELRIVYTPLHGTGIKLVPDALRRWGFFDLHMVEEQAEPNGDFPTTKSPNPEEKAAMELALALATRCNGDLVLATDPDADRLGIAVRHKGEYRLLTGNQLGSLLTWYICSTLKEQGALAPNGVVIKTIVSTKLVEAIAADFGVEVENCLTGFKYIGALIRQYEESGSPEQPSKRFLFGFEESYGYLAGTHARDKDSVVAACLTAELALWAKVNGLTLVDLLHDIYARYGVYLETQLSKTMPGMAGMQQINRLMQSLRSAPPTEVAGVKVIAMTDIDSDSRLELATGKRGRGPGLPRSNVLIFELANGSQIVARPSGTEPKIKFYFMLADREGAPFASREDVLPRVMAAEEKLRQYMADVEKIIAERT